MSSPCKSHTLSVATIQLGQHHLKPYAVTLGPSSGNTTSDLGQNSKPPPLSSFVLQPCSFDTRCTGRVRRSVRISIVHLYTLVIRLQGSCFSGQHGETVERSFPIVSRHSADNNAWIELIVPSVEVRFDKWRHRRRKQKKSRQRRSKVQTHGRDLVRGACEVDKKCSDDAACWPAIKRVYKFRVA